MDQRLTPEELALLIEKMKADLEHANTYLERLRQDKAKTKHTLEYNQDNYRYLKAHCGIIGIDYIKNISNQIERLKKLLEICEEDIQKFETSMRVHEKNIEEKQKQLAEAQKKSSRKVVLFKRKNK